MAYKKDVFTSLFEYADWLSKCNISNTAKRLTRIRHTRLFEIECVKIISRL